MLPVIRPKGAIIGENMMIKLPSGACRPPDQRASKLPFQKKKRASKLVFVGARPTSTTYTPNICWTRVHAFK
jgi:hypothetical protein